MTEQQSTTGQRGRVTWPPIRNALVQVLELPATNEGKEWSADHLIAVIDRQRKSLKSLRDKESQECVNHTGEIQNQLARIQHLTRAVRRVGEALEMPQVAITSESIETEARKVRQALTAQRKENDKLHAELAAKDGPPTLSSLVALHESNYQDIAYALGIPGSESGKTFTVRDLVDHIHHYMESTNEAYSKMTQRVEEAESMRTELVKRVEALEAELASTRDDLEVAQANEEFANVNQTTMAQSHERIEGELREDLELRAARNLVRALEAEKFVRELREDLEIAQAEANLFSRVGGSQAEENASRVLRNYDQLTLGLSFLWGDDRKEEFLRLVEDPEFMGRLEAKYRKRLKKARKAENR